MMLWDALVQKAPWVICHFLKAQSVRKGFYQNTCFKIDSFSSRESFSYFSEMLLYHNQTSHATYDMVCTPTVASPNKEIISKEFRILKQGNIANMLQRLHIYIYSIMDIIICKCMTKCFLHLTFAILLARIFSICHHC